MKWDWPTTKVLGGAVVLLLGTGALHRWVRLSRADSASAFRALPVSLSDLPSHLGPYVQTEDLPLSAEVLEVAGVDSFVHRQYMDPASGQSIQLYVGYWGYENTGMGHGPEVCYPVAGWLADSPTERLTLPSTAIDGVASEAAEMGIHHFTRTQPLGIERKAVGFLAVVNGQFRASSRGTFLHAPSDSRNGGFLAHVHVSTPVIDADWAAADTRIVDYMGRLLPHISTCLLGDAQGPIARDAADAPGALEPTGETRGGSQ